MRDYGNDCKESEGRAEAEVQLPQTQPVQALRASARISAEVRHLPSVFPWIGAQGRDPWRCEVELVEDSSQLIVRSRSYELRTVNLELGREPRTFPLVLLIEGETGSERGMKEKE